MAHRINERNIGCSKHDGAAKNRKPKPLTQEDRDFLRQIVIEVRECMQPEDGVYRDGGRFVIQLTSEQMEHLYQIRLKL